MGFLKQLFDRKIMKKRQLSNRLKTIASLMDKVSLCADIGCDHALLIIHLCEENIVQKGIGADINKGPLEKAKANINQAGLEKRIEVYLSDGLKGIPSTDIEGVIIAGMGGKLMAEIIQRDLPKQNHLRVLVCSPHSEYEALRRQIMSMNLHIVEEVMIKEEDKYYIHIKVYPGKEELSYKEEELTYGRYLIQEKSEVFKEYILKEKEKFSELLGYLEDKEGAHILKRKEQLRFEIEKINKILSR